MAGKTRRANKARKEGFARSMSRRAKNKENKQLRHQLNTEKQAENKKETTELFNQVCELYALDSHGKYALKRLIGTINKSRLQSLINKTIKKERWFISRMSKINPDKETTNAYKLIRDTKLSVFLM